MKSVIGFLLLLFSTSLYANSIEEAYHGEWILTRIQCSDESMRNHEYSGRLVVDEYSFKSYISNSVCTYYQSIKLEPFFTDKRTFSQKEVGFEEIDSHCMSYHKLPEVPTLGYRSSFYIRKNRGKNLVRHLPKLQCGRVKGAVFTYEKITKLRNSRAK